VPWLASTASDGVGTATRISIRLALVQPFFVAYDLYPTTGLLHVGAVPGVVLANHRTVHTALIQRHGGGWWEAPWQPTVDYPSPFQFIIVLRIIRRLVRLVSPSVTIVYTVILPLAFHLNVCMCSWSRDRSRWITYKRWICFYNFIFFFSNFMLNRMSLVLLAETMIYQTSSKHESYEQNKHKWVSWIENI
jgi:hypothetical protein